MGVAAQNLVSRVLETDEPVNNSGVLLYHQSY